MSTKAEQILDAVLALLTTPTALASGNVWRSRLRPIPQGKTLAIVVRRRNDNRIGDTTFGRHQRELALAVEIYAKGNEPDAVADPLIESVMTRLLGTNDNLSGLVDRITIGNVSPEWAARDADMVVMDLEFLITYESLDSVL